MAPAAAPDAGPTPALEARLLIDGRCRDATWSRLSPYQRAEVLERAAS